MIFGGLVLLFIFSAFFTFLYLPSVVLLCIFCSGVLVDIWLNFSVLKPFMVERKLEEILSLGDQNEVEIHLTNTYRFGFSIVLIEMLPSHLQERQFDFNFNMQAHGTHTIHYRITPRIRGEHSFGDITLLFRTLAMGLVERKLVFPTKVLLKVYPSLLQMRKVELQTMARISIDHGIKKIRRLGHSYEFEQIRAYVQGDDYRSINWKATGRHQELMLNQYEDERSQAVYFVLDQGRNMKMPFGGLSLLDYAVNSTLSLSNVALRKGDRVGMMSFDKTSQNFVKANSGSFVLPEILNRLYKIDQSDQEPDFNEMYKTLQVKVKQRSLIFLFTNCNTNHSLARIENILRLLGRKHLLVVVLFENTNLSEYAADEPENLEDVYEQIIAEKFLYEQKMILAKMQSMGIQAILTQPQNLTIDTLNKYLAFKAAGKI
ncbi:MAG: hypothetical protein ACI8ZN_000171 [Bacteroidia bacterium]